MVASQAKDVLPINAKPNGVWREDGAWSVSAIGRSIHRLGGQWPLDRRSIVCGDCDDYEGQRLR